MTAAPAVKLFQLPGAWGAPSISPFCVKLETHLRLAKVPFETKVGSPVGSPTGKVPWIEHEGKVVGDSQRVVDYLATNLGVDLDRALTPAEKMRSRVLRRLLESSAYFGMCWLRWMADAGFDAYKPVLRSLLPAGLGHVVVPILRRDMRKQIVLQGTGRMSEAEVNDALVHDFFALDAELGDKPWMFGDEPSSLDAVAFGFVESLLAFPVESEAQRRVRAETKLDSYRERVRKFAY